MRSTDGSRFSPAAGLVLAALCVTAAGAAAQGTTFYENLHYQVFHGDTLDPRAHLYDSEDFQSMLLLPGHGPALLLELQAGTVYEIPEDAMDLTGEDPVLTRPEAGLMAGSLEKEDGSIQIDLAGRSFRLSPAPELLGEVDLTKLLSVKPSYALDARAYEPETNAVTALRTARVPTDIYVVFGTWCQLCKRVVPAVIRTMEAVGNPNFELHFIGVDEDLTDPEDWIERLRIGATPTVIMMQDGRELGRIEETAEPSVEGALARIIGVG
ncbi:MAG: hypothetical protein GF355_05535 [Candidatus Eisenbacteria bacterium]|nr:hypothetical protein [Candidatus Eisenbacteria bacterium]